MSTFDRILMHGWMTSLFMMAVVGLAVSAFPPAEFGQPVHLYRVVRGIPGCASGKWTCVSHIDHGSRTVVMTHAEVRP
ncbi:hypothetical protein [Fimbriiglobus ruber]|uniref:Uncharacterized protein n=1 Tax=Fimbriiglobus ruber TaxID=1908690 RepID=A0A225DPU6_9BACT|nr:hypothetical protein [Fimbriiglobus ruber]OWK39526.1 hypothetical protein FRUB_06089 [Fimbriiglobus ruber]